MATDCVCASASASAAVAASSSGVRGVVELLVVMVVGLASLVVLLRLLLRASPSPAASASSSSPPSAAPSGPPSTSGVQSSSVRRAASAVSLSSTGSSHGLPPLPGATAKRSSVKERLESEIRALLPRRSTYYASPFFADTITSKHEFIDSLLDLGDDLLDGWLLVKRGAQRGRNWKKRFVVLDGNGRIKYYPNADAARKNVNIKGSLAVHAVKPADPMEFGANTLEVKGTLGGTYFFRTEGEMAARKWLCVLTKRAIQSRVPGRIDAAVGPFLGGNLEPSEPNGSTGASSAVTASGASDASSAAAAANAPPLRSHTLEALVEDMTYSKEATLRQFYVVVKFKSELHDHSSVPVGQTVPKNCEKSAINWKETLAWHFTDHVCSDCEECKVLGSRSGTFKGLPDIMVLHVYEIHLRYLTTKIGHVAVSLKEVFGFTGMKEASMRCTWPVISSTDAVLGQLTLKLNYSVDLAGGAATVPFLVTTEAERETLGEYAIHPSVKTCVEFFELFYANGTLGRWQAYFKIRGDTELEMGEWAESPEYGGQVRTFTFRALTNASIGPATTMSSQNQHVSFSDVAHADPERLVIEQRVFLHDIPYGDCFTVEQVFVIERGPNGNLVAKGSLGIPFSKGCMFKSKIISATREGVGQSTKVLFEELNKSLDGGSDAAASAPVKPFLVSTDEERHFIGQYDIHPNVTDPAQFFELFYANGTISKWTAFYKETGDTDHDISDWKDAPEFGGMIRTIKFRAQNTAPIGPPSTSATSDQHAILPKDEDDPFVLENKMELYDIPYGDCFTVETVYVVGRIEPNRIVAKVYVAIPFTKSTMFKGKIISNTKDGVSKTSTKLFEYLRRVVEAEGGPRASESDLARASMSSRPSLTDGTDTPRASSSGPRRVMLARLNSTLDGSVALEEIFENQRVSIFGKWGPNHLLPTDRERFTNRNGDVVLSFDQITHPPHWTWTSPWKIDKSYTDCDDEGWSYATDFPRFKSHLARGRSSQKRLGNSVRRRRWIRMMAYVPPDGSDGNVSPSSHSAPGSRPPSPPLLPSA